MNILITSAGRRSYLVKYFKKCLKNKGKVHVSNSIDNVPSFFEADKFVVSPYCFEDTYVPFILNYCVSNNITAVISVYDVDVGVLSKYKKLFKEHGITLVMPDSSFVEICNDKWKTYLFLKDNHFYTPLTFLGIDSVKNALKSGEISFPVVVKPRFGNGSIGVNIAENQEELTVFYEKTKRSILNSWLSFESSSEKEIVIFQQFIKGDEYGVDIINDLKGSFVTSIVKKKHGMRSGETDAATIIENNKIFLETKKIALLSNHIANLDCDGFLLDNHFYILEMNPRFGGGYPFSHAAGVDLPKAIIYWLTNKKVNKSILTAKPNCFAYKDLVIRLGNNNEK